MDTSQPKPSKTVLVVQSSDLKRASNLFHDLCIRVVTGSWFLEGFVGEQSLAADFNMSQTTVVFSVLSFSTIELILLSIAFSRRFWLY